jgi:hypothetical protein
MSGQGEVQGVDEARKEIYAKGRQIYCIPPTSDALLQHTIRAQIRLAEFREQQPTPFRILLPSLNVWKLVNDE